MSAVRRILAEAFVKGEIDFIRETDEGVATIFEIRKGEVRQTFAVDLFDMAAGCGHEAMSARYALVLIRRLSDTPHAEIQ